MRYLTPTNCQWLCPLLLTFLISYQGITQNPLTSIPIFLDGAALRIELTLEQPFTEINVCGLAPNENYHALLLYGKEYSEQQMVWSPISESNNENTWLDKNNTGREIVFQAQAACQQLVIQNIKPDASALLSLSITKLGSSNMPKPKPKPASANALMQNIEVSNTTYTTEQLIKDVFIAGGCFEVYNVQEIGAATARGHFSQGAEGVGLESGIILATGDVTQAVGPNTDEGTTTDFQDLSGDPDLNIVSNEIVRDVVGIEFDFIPSSNQISFNYVFASEEYCEYVGASFNDIFGFFISGPGINGPYSNNGENIALIPNSTMAVSINNVSHLTNNEYFKANSTTCTGMGDPLVPDLLAYDGCTQTFTASATVTPCEMYHIRLVVGDVGDGAYDSAVFLEANSFNTGGEVSVETTVPGNSGNNIIYEGCEGGFIFSRSGGDLSQEIEVPFIISSNSTTTSGVDYISLPSSAIIPAGSSSVIIPFTALEDFTTEGTENVILELIGSCVCFNPTIELQVEDYSPLLVSLTNAGDCNSNEVQLMATVSGGAPEYTFLWSDGSANAFLSTTLTASQTFSLTITDACGNTAVDELMVSANGAPEAVLSGEVLSCASVANGQLQVDFSGNAPWTFSYSLNGNTMETIITSDNPYYLEVNQEGNYVLESFIADACFGTVSGTVTVSWSELILETQFSNISCFAAADGFAAVLANGTTSSYTYLWSTGDTTDALNGLSTGAYGVTVTNSEGCTADAAFTITEPTALTATVVQTQGIDCLHPFGAATLNYQGGTPGYNVLWENGNTIDNPENLDVGINLVQVTDGNGCMVELNVNIDSDLNVPMADASVSGLLTCTNTTVQLEANVINGSGVFDYIWSDAFNTIISNNTIATASETGLYQVEITDLSNGCQGIAEVVVSNNVALPSVVIADVSPLDCINTTALMDGSASTGNGTLSFQWQDANGVHLSDEATIQVNSAGLYTLIITDVDNGCSAQSNYTLIANNNPPVAEVGPSDTLYCDGEPVVLEAIPSTGQGALSYEWYDEAGSLLSTSSDVAVLLEGPFTLVVTDAFNGCTAATAYTVPVNADLLVADAGNGGVLNCIQNAVLLGGNTTSTGNTIVYEWRNDVGELLANTPTFEATTPGVYTLLVVDTLSACSTQQTVVVTEDLIFPVVDLGTGGLLTCENVVVSLGGGSTSSGAVFNYQWTDANNSIISNDWTIAVTTPGTYTLLVNNLANGCTASQSLSIEQEVSIPLAEAGMGGVLPCNNSSFTLNGLGSATSPDINYTWTNEAGDIIGNELMLEVNQTGTYILSVVNAMNGCSDADTVQVLSDPTVPIASIEPADTLDCHQLSVLIDATNSVSNNSSLIFEWQNASHQVLSNEPDFETANSGVYTLFITDSGSGCTAMATVEVIQDISLPALPATTNYFLNCNTTTVLLDATNGNTGSMNYAWFDPSDNLFSDQASTMVSVTGIYTLQISNPNNGCESMVDIFVEEDGTVLSGVNLLITNPDCNGERGVIAVSECVGGTPPFKYSLNGDAFDSFGYYPKIGTGDYTLMITDAKGCTWEEVFRLEPLQKPELEIVDEIYIDLGEEVQLEAILNLPLTEIAQLIWTPANTLSCDDCLTPMATPSFTTNYHLRVKTKEGCTATATTRLLVNRERHIYVPSAFSPNNDGINDVLMIYADEEDVKEVRYFRVFNRWGEAVFEKTFFPPNSKTEGWYGTFKGTSMSPGIYIYTAEVEYNDGYVMLIRGDVTLMK